MADLDITIHYGDLSQQVARVDFAAAGLRPDASGRSALLNEIGGALNALAAAAGVYDSYIEMMAKAKGAMQPGDFVELAASQPTDMQVKLQTAGLVTEAVSKLDAAPAAPSP